MISIKLIRENPDLVIKNLEKRKDEEKLKWIKLIQNLDEKSRELKGKIDDLRSKRNILSSKINETKKNGGDIKPILEEVKNIPDQIEELEKEREPLEKELRYYLMRLPNILHESVPEGGSDEDNIEVQKFGTIRDFDFDPQLHQDILEKRNLLEIDRASKITGARWYFLKNNLALLERALTNYAIDFLTKKGYEFVTPPFFMNRSAYESVTDLEDFENMMYKIDGEDNYLIATSEHPMTAMFKDEVIDVTKPKKLVSFSSCFRKEVGAHSRGDKGVWRVHKFVKVEQLIFSHPKDSWALHEEITSNAIEFFESLKIPFRKILICTGDIGIVAAKKYDLEAWIPSEKKYKEIVSASNCTEYQSVRANIKFREENQNKYVHTLNSTLVATTRALVAIVENYQNEDGSVDIPEVLQPYMNGIKKI